MFKLVIIRSPFLNQIFAHVKIHWLFICRASVRGFLGVYMASIKDFIIIFVFSYCVI